MRTRTTALVAIVALMALAAPSVRAQTAPDLKKILFNAANNLGMLRSVQQVDSIITLRIWLAGTATVNGQTVKVSNYNIDARWPRLDAGPDLPFSPGLRVDMTYTGADGKPQRRVEVVAAKSAWNETAPGMNPTPAQQTFNERALWLWTLPHGAVKAATMAGANTKASVENGKNVLTFPAPNVPGATIKMTLSAKTPTMIDQVETRDGTVVTQTNYTDYGEQNESDYKADIMFPKRIVRMRGGATILDLTTIKTNTYNPYVIMPIPQSVMK